VARISTLPFRAQPGEAFIYGYSTDILGVVIEAVSGQSLAEFLGARIIQPLGMVDTHSYLPDSKRDRLAAVYSLRRDGALTRAPNPGGMVGQGMYVEGPRVSYSGGAGLLSTASDYTRFLQMMLNGGELDGVRILSRKSVDLMTVNHIGDISPQFSGSGRGFGLGFYVILDVGKGGAPASYGEYGWGGAYHTTYWVDPEEDMVDLEYRKNKRPVGHWQANTDLGILPLSSLLVVALGEIRLIFTDFGMTSTAWTEGSRTKPHQARSVNEKC
jgi:CubicO group peptidase (beta-lactamase class C family)